MEILLLAGARYRETIERFLRQRGYSVTVPMEGLGSGRQLRWLKHAADGRSPGDLDRFYSLPAQLATAAKKSK